MHTEEKLIKMFTITQGEMSRSCSLEIEEDENYIPCGVNVVKNGEVCWSRSKTDILFDYVTRNWS